MRKVLYTKFSRERRNEFQIMTRITEEDGIRRVWKLPLQKEGELHIRHMYENYRKLEHLYAYAGVQICPCELDEEKCALAFPFVEGESLETRISRHGKEKDFASLKKDYELLYQIIASAKGKKSFVETDAFCEVFGHPALKEGLAAAEISNIDMIPGNLLLDGEKVWVADYEWVFPFAVPIAFIYARSVFLQEAASAAVGAFRHGKGGIMQRCVGDFMDCGLDILQFVHALVDDDTLFLIIAASLYAAA